MNVEQVNHAITKWSKVGGLILLGWFSSSAYHRTLVAETAKKELPALQAEAGCEHWRAETSAAVAKKAITAANDLTAPVPSTKAIPRDCPHPALSSLK